MWVTDLGSGILEHTVFTVLGVHPNWLAVLPVLLAIGAAIAFAAAATPRAATAHPRDSRYALGALGAWVVVSIIGPTISSDPVTPLDGGGNSFVLIAIGAVAALAALLQLWFRRSRPEEATGSPLSRLALGDRTS